MPIAGRSSSGQLPRPSSTWPRSSSRITASCSAPEISRISWSYRWRRTAKAIECTERTSGALLTKPLSASRSEISARIRAAASLEEASTTIPLASSPCSAARSAAATAVSTRKLVTPAPAWPTTFHRPVSGSAVGHERAVVSRVRGTK